MSTLKNRRPRNIVLTMIVALMVIVVVAILSNQRGSRISDSSHITMDQYPRIAAEWQEKKYVPIELGTSISNLVSKMFIYKTTSIAIKQEQALREAVILMITAFHSGDYEDYRRFRTPRPAKINREKWNGAIAPRLAYYEQQSLTVPAAPEDALRYDYGMRFGGLGMTNFWVGLCKEETEIIIQWTKQDLTPIPQIAMGKKNAGVACPQPTFLFDRSPMDIVKDKGSVTVATVSILIQHSAPDPCFPYICRFYWDEDSACWIPDGICFSWVSTAGLQRMVDF
jgi:hypothetical protein